MRFQLITPVEMAVLTEEYADLASLNDFQHYDDQSILAKLLADTGRSSPPAGHSLLAVAYYPIDEVTLEEDGYAVLRRNRTSRADKIYIYAHPTRLNARLPP